MEDLQSFPYKVFQLRDTSNPFWYQSDSGLNQQVTQAGSSDFRVKHAHEFFRLLNK